MVAVTLRYPAASAKLRSLLDRHGVTIASVLLLILLAWLLAKWTWLFLQPKEVVSPTAVAMAPVDTNAATERIVNAHPFGVAGERAAPEEAQVSTLNLRLKGVFAFSLDSPAFAIVNTGAKNDEAFKIGDEVVPGAVLNEVQPTYILIKRGGALEKVNLEERAGGGGGIASPPIPNRPPVNPRPSANVPSTGNYNLSRGEINAQMRDPKQMANLGRVAPSPTGGVSVEDVPPNSLAEKLGLQIGDVIRVINGNAVNSPADLARLYQQLGQTGQVRVEGTRGGHPLNLNYNVQQ